MNENKTVTFHCNATGNPTPKITWTKDGKTVGTGSELIFVALRSDAGRYWCSADNGLSAGVKANANLRVLSKNDTTSKLLNFERYKFQAKGRIIIFWIGVKNVKKNRSQGLERQNKLFANTICITKHRWSFEKNVCRGALT